MAGRNWTEVEDNFIRANAGALTDAEIGSAIGRTFRAVGHRRDALGIKTDPKVVGVRNSAKWRDNLEAKLGKPVDEWLRQRYVAEEASYRELCAEANINTRSLMKLLRETGIEPINARMAVKRQIERNPDFLKPFIEAGQRKDARVKTAIIREQTRSHMSEGEYKFLAALNEAGLSPVPQMALESYNIDFAFPDVKLAVEWDPRWHRSPVKRPIDHRRDERLIELGWTVLRLDERTSDATNVRKVSEALKSLA